MANSSSLILSVKFILMSIGVVFIAFLLSFSLPSLLSSAPNIWCSFRAWLKPPYLYVIINGIIITIAASTRLHHKHVDNSSSYDQYNHYNHTNPVVKESSIPVPVPASVPAIPGTYQPLHDHHYHAPPPLVMSDRVVMNSGADKYHGADHQYYGEVSFTSVVNQMKETTMPGAIREETVGDDHELVKEHPVLAADKARFEKRRDNNPVGGYVNDLKRGGVACGKDAAEKNEKANWTLLEKQDSIAELLAKVAQRPPVSASARFGHRRPVRAALEGGKALRVSKPKKQETLESTWKAITEGRRMPLTRHLKKPDTWENHLEPSPPLPLPQVVKNCETVQNRTNYLSPSATQTGCLGKLKKEPSLSQDDLNRRVEAFINKFNEDMRLQRQQSIQQFMERINRVV